MGNSVRISQREVLLQTNWRDIRVTGRRPASICMSEKNKIKEFISALFGRLTRHKGFIASDFILRRSRSSSRVQQLIKNLQINLSLRLELALQKFQLFRKTEQYTPTRMLTMVLPRPIEPAKTRFPLAPRPNLESPSDMRKKTAASLSVRKSASFESHRSTPIRFAPVEMIMHGRRFLLDSNKPEQRHDLSYAPRTNLFKEESQIAPKAIDQINLRHLTDQVVEALDRRMTSAQERMARR